MSDHPELCVGASVVHEDRLLLVERGRGPGVGLWSVPGGRVELAEETGLDGTVDRVVGWVERIDAGHHFVIVDYLVRIIDPSPARAGDDAASLRWVALAELRRLPDVVPGLVDFLDEHGLLPPTSG